MKLRGSVGKLLSSLEVSVSELVKAFSWLDKAGPHYGKQSAMVKGQ